MRLGGSEDVDLFLAAALTSSYARQGHICLTLGRVAGKRLLEDEDALPPVVCPALKVWQRKLANSSVVGKAGDFRPLIMDKKSRLYLHRYWEYERRLAQYIRSRMTPLEDTLDMKILAGGMARLFKNKDISETPGQHDEIDWQQVSAFTALSKRFCFISGGPGTGKTTTVAKILTLILEQPCLRKFRIALAAPTGKAAARLQDAIRTVKVELNTEGKIKEAIPEDASTIHRLLGAIPGSPYFRHHGNNRLPLDVLVVDEASMVDLALMSKLVQALPPQARLILLGDKDQLASVEAGAVLGDLCGGGRAGVFSHIFSRSVEKSLGVKIPPDKVETRSAGMQDCVVQLTKNYRFGTHSGIAALSEAVNNGDADRAVSLLVKGKIQGARWQKLPAPNALFKTMQEPIVDGFSDYLKAQEIEDAFSLFDRFRILCALREGPYGVRAMNALAERILKEAGLIASGKNWYRGRPVLVSSNDYHLQLFNGDVGILWPDPAADNELRAFFLGGRGILRKFHPLRLPVHETVFATTVHKSQGSEFEHLMLVMPEQMYPVLTRELLYTAITRARKTADVWGVADVFQAAVGNRTERMSGLQDALWGKEG